MPSKTQFVRVRPLIRVWLVTLCTVAAAQKSGPITQITQAIDESHLTVLRGNTAPLARAEFDVGTAEPALPLDRMLLVLKRSGGQESELRKLLENQHDKASPSYHQWLTPDEFGTRFGPADADVQTITNWLQSHGFQKISVSHGRTVIEFSGSAGLVQQGFHTAIRQYVVNGEEHWANDRDPQIPTALAPVVAGIVSLHNFPKKPQHRVIGTFSNAAGLTRFGASGKDAPPLFTTAGGGCGLLGGHCYGVGPYDFATIYNVLPLWNASSPIDGTGQTIAIVGQSDIYPQDFSNFRSYFGLPPGSLNIIYNGSRPDKLASQGDELESDLDVEWAGAIAKGATIDLVASTSTNTTAGVDLSAQYIVDNNLAPILSESYGACELDIGTAGNQFYYQLWQQASAEGITAFVSTGDSGSDVCDRDAAIATQGLSVNGISSTPYNIAVGGTDFDDLQNPAAYWNLTNNPTTLESAIGYIPERAWNDTCTNDEFFQFTGAINAENDCNDKTSPYLPFFLVPVGGSGGASTCTNSSSQDVSTCAGGYDKPVWQSGSGVPNDSKRDVPDVSLYAADGVNASFYVACETDIYEGCDIALGGTSVSSPAFAGIMALVNEKMQSRQGLANYVFYPLASRTGASCDSSKSPNGSCIFNDVTIGTIAVPCTTGTPDCVTTNPGDLNGVLSGYAAKAGYDLATGLGSVNVTNLVNNWSTVTFRPTTVSLSLNPSAQITHGTPVNVNITVSPKSGTGKPSGPVMMLTSTGKPAGTFLLNNGIVSTATGLLPGGNYTVTAHYAGDGTYVASDSSPGIPVIVNPEGSATFVQAFTLDQNGNSTPFTSGPYGGSIVYLNATAAGKSGQGMPTGTVSLTQTGSGTTTTNLQGNPFALNSQGSAIVPDPGYNYWAYSPGTYTIAANYSGDASFQKSSTPGASFTVTQASTNTITNMVLCSQVSGGCAISVGGMVEIFANVNYSGGAFDTGGVFISQPTGTVTFYSNGVAISPALPVDSSIVPPVVSMSTTQLPPGVDNITAQYSGDANFLGSTSSSSPIYVGQGFSIAANPKIITIASPGQSGSTTLTFTSQNGLAGSTPLSPSMCSNLPPKSTCSFNPANVTFTANTTSVAVTLTITTSGPSANLSSQRRTSHGVFLGLMAIFLAVPLGLTFSSGARFTRRVFTVLIAIAMIAAALSCGGGSGSGVGGNGGSGSGGNNPGTPAGNYSGVTVTVSINGTTQSNNSLSVNVQ